jgi:charged multivesicular body protein 3
MFSNLLGNKTLKDEIKEIQRKLSSEYRNIERQISRIKIAEIKAQKEAKKAAKLNNIDCVRILAKEIVNTKKTIKRLHIAKTHINSIILQIKIQESQINLTKNFQKSTEIMKTMNSLCNLPAISTTMQNLSAEMIKMGLIEEMVSDAIDNTFDDLSDKDCEEVEEEISKVVDEIVCDIKSKTSLPTNNMIEKKELQDQEETAEELLEKINKSLNS